MRSVLSDASIPARRRLLLGSSKHATVPTVEQTYSVMLQTGRHPHTGVRRSNSGQRRHRRSATAKTRSLAAAADGNHNDDDLEPATAATAAAAAGGAHPDLRGVEAIGPQEPLLLTSSRSELQLMVSGHCMSTCWVAAVLYECCALSSWTMMCLHPCANSIMFTQGVGPYNML